MCMSNLQFLVSSANNKEIFYDPVNSHTATHFEDTPQLKRLAQEILAKVVLDEEFVGFDTDLQRIVGNTDLVTNEEGDVIVWAKRKNRDVYTSFNKTQRPQPCSIVSTALQKIDEERYELVSAWIGLYNTPTFPGDPNETEDSKSYWLAHSLAWGTQEIQLGTETSNCPW